MRVERHGVRLLARAAWILATVVTAALLASVFYQPLGWGPRLVVIALAITAAWRPFDGLLLLAGLSPFANTILALTRTAPVPLNFFEAMVLAFLLGCAARRAIELKPVAVPGPFGVAAAILLSIAIASVITSAFIIRIERPDAPLGDLFRDFIVKNYLVRFSTLSAGMLVVEGVALMLMTTDCCQADSNRQIRVLQMMALSAAAAAFLNVLRIVNSALVQPEPWRGFLTQFATVRANMHFPDLNAAGSYFVLSLFLALGLTRSRSAFAAVAAVLIAAGVWVAGSRTALVAALAIGTAALLLRLGAARHRVTLSVALLFFVVLVAIAGWKWYPQGRNFETGSAVAYRITTSKIALDFIGSHPAFGIGPGNFYESSAIGDNAHNNYLQIAAELGLPALGLFICVTVLAVRASWRHATQSWPAWGLALGLVAYLVTCLTGHPLLVAGAAYPFWMALGLATSFDSPTSSSATLRRTGLVAVLLIAATLPLAMSSAGREADVEHSSVGFSKWQQQSNGARYRWAGGRATFFVSPAARSLRIPLRRGPLAPEIVEVTIYLDGIEANRVILRSGDEENIVRLNLLRRAKTRFARIDLECREPGHAQPLDIPSSESGGILMVGRPIPEI